MNTTKTSRSLKPAHILVGSILALLAPSVSAGVLYTENFALGIDGFQQGNINGNNLTGWTTGAYIIRNITAGLRGGASTPDGDGQYMSKWDTESGRWDMTARPGEYTLKAADRLNTEFKVDFASTTTRGMRFIALIDNKYYASDLIGTVSGSSTMASSGIVTKWAADQTINAETGNWYEWPASRYNATGVVGTPVKGLPVGDISIFGLMFNNGGNGDGWAADNFRILGASATEKYVWDGGSGNFGAANWTIGGPSGQTAVTGTAMVIDTAGSTANVAADFLSAKAVAVGHTAASTLDVNSGFTLGVVDKVTVGASGTLSVNGTLNSPNVTVSRGSLAISNTGTLAATDLQIDRGSVTVAATGTLAVSGQLRLDGGTLTHNGATAVTPSVLIFNGGTLAGSGSVVPTTRYEVHNTLAPGNAGGGVRSVGSNLTGGGGLTAYGTQGLIVELTGTNTYSGTTTVSTRSILRIPDLAVNLGGGNLFLQSTSGFQDGATNRPAILETKGTFSRAIGAGVGAVSFSGGTGDGASAAGFSAYGGPLTINFGGAAAAVDMSTIAPASGANILDLFLGFSNGNDVLTLVNPLDLKGNRNIYVTDNTTSTGDYAIISGAINNGDASARNFTKQGNGRLVLSGVSTYTGTTTVSSGLLEIGGAGQLSPVATPGNYAGNLAISGGAPNGFKYNSSATQILSGIVSGSGALLKSGSGTLTLSGAAANTHTGTTTVDGGTLIMAGAVAPTGNSAVAANAAGTVGTLQLDYTTNTAGKINDAAVLSLGGGTIDLKGAHVATGIEIVGSTTLNPGASQVTQSVVGTVLRMNAMTRNAGGVINFAAPSIADTDKTNTNGILGPWATLNNTDWAINSTNAGDGAITAILPAGYTDIDATASVIADVSTTNVRLNAAGGGGNITLGAGTTNINTLLQGTGTAATVDTVFGGTTTLRTGGIMIASGQESLTIGAAAGDGTLTHNTGSGNNPDLVLINNNAAKTLTINAVIANNGTTGLATAGAGPIVLAAANTFTGTTNANGGELRLANALALQSSTLNTTVNNTIKFAAGVTAATLGGLSGSGGFALQDTAAAAVALTVGNNSATTTFLGALSGTGSLIKSGTGTLTLSGDLTYTGGTTVSSTGTLILAGNNVAATGDITVGTGASVRFDAPVSISGTGRNVKPANSATTRVISGYAIDNAFLNRLEETGNAFTIALNSASPNNLDLNTSAGAILPNASLAAGPTNAVTYTGTITPNASTYRFGGGPNALTLNTVLADSGGATALVKTGTDTLILQGDNTYTGITTIASGGTLQVGLSNGLTGRLGSGDVTNNGTLNFRRGFDFAFPALTVANNIGGTGSLVKDNGNGTIILSGTNSYSGTTTVSAGALQYNSTAAVAIGGGAAVRDVTVNANATLIFGPAFGAGNIAGTLVDKIAAASGGAIAADNYAATNFDFQTAGLTAASLGAVGNVNYTGTLTQQSTTYRLGGGGGTLTMANINAITGGNALTVNGLGGSTVILPVANDYTGKTTINSAGALRIGDAAALGTADGTAATDTTVISGGALELYNNKTFGNEALSLNGSGVSNVFASGNVNTGALRNLSGNNTWTGLITLAGGTRIQSDSGTLTIDTAGPNAITGTQAVTFGGAGNVDVADTINIVGQTLTKEGSGRLALTGTNTYSGTTTILHGVLFAISGTGLPATSLLSLSSETFAAGVRSFNGGVLESNGTFARNIANAPGNNVFWTGDGGFAAKGGTLDVTLNAGATIDWANTTVGFNSPATFLGNKVLVLNSETADNVVTMKNPINMNGNRTITVLDNPNSTADYAHLDNVLSGGNLAKHGPGRLLLSAANTYNGTTTIIGGSLALGGNAPSGGAGTLGNTTSEVVLGGAGYGNNAGLIVTGGAFTVGRIIRIPTLDVTDPGTRVLTIGGDTAHSSVFSGSIFLGSSSNAGKGVTLTAAASGQVTFSGVIQNPSSMDATVYTVTKSGAGTVIFSHVGMAAGGYTGLTLVADGTLQLGVNNGIRSGNAVTVAPTGASSVLDLGGFNQTIGGAGLTIGGATTSSAASVIGTASTLTLSGGATAVTYNAANNPLGATISATNITLGAAALPQTFTVGDSTTVTGVGNELTISSTITEFGAGSALVKEGTGSLKLDGAQSYNILTVNDGTANVNGILGTAPGLAVVTVTDAGNGTKLRFGSVSQTLSSLTIGAGATVIFTSGAASGAFSGNDKGAGFAGGAAVPEPGTLGLLLVGALGMLNRRRRA